MYLIFPDLTSPLAIICIGQKTRREQAQEEMWSCLHVFSGIKAGINYTRATCLYYHVQNPNG